MRFCILIETENSRHDPGRSVGRDVRSTELPLLTISTKDYLSETHKKNFPSLAYIVWFAPLSPTTQEKTSKGKKCGKSRRRKTQGGGWMDGVGRGTASGRE